MLFPGPLTLSSPPPPTRQDFQVFLESWVWDGKVEEGHPWESESPSMLTSFGVGSSPSWPVAGTQNHGGYIVVLVT